MRTSEIFIKPEGIMDISKIIAEELSIKPEQVEATVKLIDEGNTIPFIARYRKEATGALNDEVLRKLDERLTYLRGLSERQEAVIKSIEEQGKLTDELKEKILAARTMVEVEDLYMPYKQKRRTRAMVAIEKGLEPLADAIYSQSLEVAVLEEAAKYIDAEKKVETAQDAVDGAKDIIAEKISDNAEFRGHIRDLTFNEGLVVSSRSNAKITEKDIAAKEEEQKKVYEMYYEFTEPVKSIVGYRVLAINRGENEKILTVKIEAPVDEIISYLEKSIIKKKDENTDIIISEAVKDGYDRLIAPSIERDIRSELTEKAEDGAIGVFGKNLAQLLMQPPIEGQVVLGWDPGIRTGCKIAVVDATGKVLDTTVVYATTNKPEMVNKSKEIIKKLILKDKVTLISLGNGTASRESEKVIVEIIKELGLPVKYIIVNEAGASVYSASKAATEEFPNFDVGQRSATSMARRLQDPLAELVKIEPQSMGVGQYQHDMDKKKLSEALAGVVEDCVNKVGVNLNTASASLLEYVSGISKAVAKNIVTYREENGKFTNRKQLLKVPKLGPKAFEQCAGFLRINDGDEVLDATGVHPETYDAAKSLLSKLGLTEEDVKKLMEEQRQLRKEGKAEPSNASKAAEKPEENRKDNKKDNRRDNRKDNRKPAPNTEMAKLIQLAMGDSGNNGKNQRGDKYSAANNDGRNGAATGNSASGNLAVNNSAAAIAISGKIKDRKKMAEELGIGELTLNDIIGELEKPCRDPRDEMPKPILKSDVLEIEDLKEGMVLKGTVRNIMDFGAFIDIGVHQDGLVHISQMKKNGFVKHPLDVVSVGDIVDIKVMSVDVKRKRIQLSMII